MKQKEEKVVKLSSKVEDKIVDKILALAQYLGETEFYPYQEPFARRLAESVVTNEGATLSALFSRQCIAENSLIMDRNGNILPIEKHPSSWKTKDVTELYEIKVRGGHVILCTEEHPIATDKGWTPAQEIKKGDMVVVLDKWDKFGDGKIPYKDKMFTMNNELAELTGWLVANIKSSEQVKIVKDYARVRFLVEKYFPDVPLSNYHVVPLIGTLKIFLKNIIKFDSYGSPYGLNYFTKEQLINFFYPLFLTNGKTYKKTSTIKFILKGCNKQSLLFLKEHLNKLGLHGNYEVWIGHNIIFQCITNFFRFKELFGELLPKEYFPPLFIHREQRYTSFEGEDGETLVYSKVHSIKKIQTKTSVWDITIPDKGWFLCSGAKVHNSGKCLAKGTEIVMYDGTFKKVEDVCVGDKLLTPDSKSVKVTSTVNGKDTMYKISPTMKNQQDASYVVNSAHILSLYNTETKRIEDINVLDYINSPNKVNYRGIRAVAYFPKRKTYIAPYFLGLWLGDGDSRDTRITNVDKEIVDYLYEYAANLNMKISTYSYSNRTPSYSITSKEDSTRSYSNQHRVNIIRKEMEHLNLFGNKHIPEDYLCNSYENRMQLLAGLIDSDGSLDKHQVRYEISCSNNILCEQIVRLARSLGFQVTLSKRFTSCNKKDFVSNRIVIYGEIWKIPVRVARKKAPKGSIKKNPLLYKIKVEEVGLGEYCGFTLDNKEKRFLLKDFTITHNTQVVAMVTAACMIVLPTLADKFPDNFGMFKKGFWAGCFGPVGEQAITMFDRIYEVFTTDNSKRLFIEELKMPIPARGGARGNLIRLGNKSFVRYMSGSKRAKVESKTYHLIILDECQDIDAFKIRKSINPMGAAVNATTVSTGTPDVYIGYFYDTIEQNKGYDLKNPSSKQLHFEVDYSIAQKYNPYYKKYIQREIKRLGFDSDEFKMAYRLIWPITKGMVFTKTQLDEKAYDKSYKTVKLWKETPCVAGLDLGKTQDSTVVTVIRPVWEEAEEDGSMPKYLLNWLEIEGDNWEDQYPQVIDFLSNYWIDTLVCDTTGVGDPIRERYSALLPAINVVPFIFSPTQKDIGYKYLIQEINNRRLIIPAHSSVRNTMKFKKFEQQMTTLKKTYSGKFLNPCPVDKEKGHDDYCLSEDTEILTARGFVGIDSIQDSDLVVNYNLDGTLTYSYPNRIIKDSKKEYMVLLEGPYVSQLLTNNHKILYEHLTSENETNLYKQKIGMSQDALNRIPNSTFRLICSGKQSQPEYNISDEEIQLGAWMITEGWVSKSKKWNDARYQLGQSSTKYPEKVALIDTIVESLGLSYNRYVRKDGLVIWQFRKVSKAFFDNLLNEGIHTIPRPWLAFFSQRQLQLLLDTLMLGDGTVSRNTYHTKDKKHAENIQELVFRLGKQATISFQPNNKAGIYNVYIRNNHTYGTLNKIEKVLDYDGRTWCVTIDSGFIVIKRDNKISITGNCDSLMLAVFGTFFEVMPEIEEFSNDFFWPTRDNVEQVFGRNYSRSRKQSIYSR